MIGIPKPRPRALDQKDRKRKLMDLDVTESQRVRARANGRCEMRERLRDGTILRCVRKSYHLDHLLGGTGRRGRGASALALHKLHLCAKCHAERHAHILKRIGGAVPTFADVYERQR